MTLNDVYLVSQIAGVIFVAISIIYLAFQVRQNTAQMRANASQQYLEASKDLNLAIISNPQMASVYRRGVDGMAGLDPDERTQFMFYIGHFYQSFSNSYDLWKSGAMADSAWHVVRKHLISMMGLKGTREVWDAWAHTGLAPDFVAYAEALPAAGEATYSLRDMLDGRPMS